VFKVHPLNAKLLISWHTLQYACPLWDKLLLSDEEGVHLMGQRCPFHPSKVNHIEVSATGLPQSFLFFESSNMIKNFEYFYFM
jgi:hypothetical protein